MPSSNGSNRIDDGNRKPPPTLNKLNSGDKDSALSGGRGRQRQLARCGQGIRSRPQYLFVVAVVSSLVYFNLKGLLLLSENASSDHNEFDKSPLHWSDSPTENSSATTRHQAATSTNISKVLNQSFHIYWLTSTDDSELRKKQRKRMENAFRTFRLHKFETRTIGPQGIVTRVPLWTVEQAKDSLKSTDASTSRRLFLSNNITIKMKSENPKRPNEYTYDDAALLMTHLTALSAAYEAGHEQVLIVQDNAILSQEFFDYWLAYASLAPNDWTVLQWTTSNLPTMEQTLPLPEPWISWLPDLWGTHAYLINRRGLEAIWKAFAIEKHRSAAGTWSLHYTLGRTFEKIFLVEELLFSLPNQIAYTSTFPWILSDDIRASFDLKTKFGAPFATIPPSLPLPDLSNTAPIRNESVLVFMNVRFSTSKQMNLEVDRALADLDSLCTVHRYTKCHWIIHGVFKHDYLYERFREQHAARFSSTNMLDFPITVSETRFNKFALLVKHLSTMKEYDLVLVKDNDQRLVGFPWASFLEKKGNALVAGPLRQAPEESFLRTKIWEKSQHYKFHDAQGWKQRGFAPWATSIFVNAERLEVPFLEMYFNVFDGQFAEWFFSQVLTRNFTDQGSCWGPDFLWCPAATEYASMMSSARQDSSNSSSTSGITSGIVSTSAGGERVVENRTGCVLVPFVSVHEDTRQITKDGDAFNDRGYLAVENLRASNPAFERWYGISYKYARGIIAWRQLDAITKHCRRVLRSARIILKATDPIDFRGCIKAGMERKTII